MPLFPPAPATPGIRQPADMGYLSWTYDPAQMVSNTGATNGTIYMFGIKLYSPQTITNLSVFNAIVAVTPTASQNWMALVDSTGAVQGKTAAGQIDTATTVLGELKAAMSAPYAAPAGRYWVAVLFNAATPLQLGRGVGFATAPNLSLTAANYWYCVNGTSATVIPPSFTPASNVTTNLITGWAAVS